MMIRFICALAFLGLAFVGCSPNNVDKNERFSQLFDSAKVQGAFMLYDNGQGKFLVHNLPRFRDSSFVPGAMFHPVISLVALKTGRADNELFRFDSSASNGSSLTQAFAQNDTAWFSRMAQRIGRDTLKYWVDSLSYGNRQMNPLNGFWHNGSLLVKPDEQLGLLKKLYFDQLPFDKRSMRLTRNMMTTVQNSAYTLAYLNTEVNQSGRRLRCISGWIEENKHPYFFLLHADDLGAEAAHNLLWKLLHAEDLGFGKR